MKVHQNRTRPKMHQLCLNMDLWKTIKERNCLLKMSLYFCISVFPLSMDSHQFAPIYKVGSFIPTMATSLAQIDNIFMFNQLCTCAKILVNFYPIISFEESNCCITVGNHMSNFMKKSEFLIRLWRWWKSSTISIWTNIYELRP